MDVAMMNFHDPPPHYGASLEVKSYRCVTPEVLRRISEDPEDFAYRSLNLVDDEWGYLASTFNKLVARNSCGTS